MHELGLMQGVVDVLSTSAETHGITRIKKVNLVVGKFTAALPDALQFAFSVLSRSPLLAEAVLEIEEREIKGQCRDCSEVFAADDYRFVCPSCGKRRIDIIAGRELYVESYEGE